MAKKKNTTTTDATPATKAPKKGKKVVSISEPTVQDEMNQDVAVVGDPVIDVHADVDAAPFDEDPVAGVKVEEQPVAVEPAPEPVTYIGFQSLPAKADARIAQLLIAPKTFETLKPAQGYSENGKGYVDRVISSDGKAWKIGEDEEGFSTGFEPADHDAIKGELDAVMLMLNPPAPEPAPEPPVTATSATVCPHCLHPLTADEIRALGGNGNGHRQRTERAPRAPRATKAAIPGTSISACELCRWMGYEGFNTKQARAGLDALGISLTDGCMGAYVKQWAKRGKFAPQVPPAEIVAKLSAIRDGKAASA